MTSTEAMNSMEAIRFSKRRTGVTFKEAQTQMMMMMMIMAAPSVFTTMYSVDYEGSDPTLKEPMV